MNVLSNINIIKKERPEFISKLAMYLIDKEPLIYLFIINSDFIATEDIPLNSFAGVGFYNRRVQFIYHPDRFKEYSTEEIYFVVLHEAFHIFKKHLTRHEELKNPILRNISQDAVINWEINEIIFNYNLKPKQIDGTIIIPKKFKEEYSGLGKDAYTTERIYNWYLNNKITKKDLLRKGSYVKKKDSGEYGKIKKVNNDGTYQVEKINNKEDLYKDVIIDNILNNNEEEHSNAESKENEDNLIPVVFGSEYRYSEDGIEVDMPFDIHMEGNEENEIQNKAEIDIFTRKLYEKAKEMERHNVIKTAGSDENNLMRKIGKLLESKVNWKKELRRNFNLFISDNSYYKSKKKSYINYLWNPKSRYGIMHRHFIEEIGKIQSYIIIVIDTSGSIFYDKYELETFFTEIEAISKMLEFNKTGKILTIQWDTKIQEPLNYYKKGDWKKFTTDKKHIHGGGSTIPLCVFNYINEIFVKNNGSYFVNENDIKFIAEKKKLPLLLFLTDGYFFRPLEKKDLGIYKECEKQILYFTKKTDLLYPKNYIEYKSAM